MLLDGFFETLSEFTGIIKKKFRNIYQNSSFYEKKISKTFDNEFIYKPSPHLLSSIIKYQNKKYKIESKRLKGCKILLDQPSVTGTANIIMSSVLADGETTIYNAACEPYIPVSYTHLTLPTSDLV